MPESYFPLDVNFFDHPKIVGLSDTALRLYLSSIAYSNRLMTDGYIAEAVIGRLIDVPWDSNHHPADYAKELVRARLWEEAEGGFDVHNFLIHNHSRAYRLGQRVKERDRKAAYRQRQRESQRDEDEQETEVSRRDTSVPATSRGRLKNRTEQIREEKDPSGREATARDLIADYVVAYRTKAGHDPPSRVKGHLARELRQALEDGIPYDVVREGLEEWFTRDLHPSALASIIESRARGGRSRPTTRQERGRAQLIETSQVMARWAASKEGGRHGSPGVEQAGGPPERELPRPGTPT